MSHPDARRDELRDNLGRVRHRIAEACRAAGRPADELTLIAITKFFPATDAVLLAEAGLTELGESRDQEASAKLAQFKALTAIPVHWHFVGRLQTNKARSVASYADLVHSLDRPGLVAPLASGAARAGRRLPVLVQLSLDADPDRGGSAADELLRLADQVAGRAELRLAGVMAIAPLAADPDPAFELLARTAERLRAAHPAATIVSAGMSGDLESAVRHGATHLRIGTALLGRRATNVG